MNERSRDAQIRWCDYETETQSKKGKRRLEELERVFKKNMKYLELTEDFTQNQVVWTQINSFGLSNYGFALREKSQETWNIPKSSPAQGRVAES